MRYSSRSIERNFLVSLTILRLTIWINWQDAFILRFLSPFISVELSSFIAFAFVGLQSLAEQRQWSSGISRSLSESRKSSREKRWNEPLPLVRMAREEPCQWSRFDLQEPRQTGRPQTIDMAMRRSSSGWKVRERRFSRQRIEVKVDHLENFNVSTMNAPIKSTIFANRVTCRVNRFWIRMVLHHVFIKWKLMLWVSLFLSSPCLSPVVCSCSWRIVMNWTTWNAN